MFTLASLDATWQLYIYFGMNFREIREEGESEQTVSNKKIERGKKFYFQWDSKQFKRKKCLFFEEMFKKNNYRSNRKL